MNHKKNVYCIITLSLIALAVLVCYSSNHRDFIVGITASLVAAYIFTLLLDIIRRVSKTAI